MPITLGKVGGRKCRDPIVVEEMVIGSTLHGSIGNQMKSQRKIPRENIGHIAMIKRFLAHLYDNILI